MALVMASVSWGLVGRGDGGARVCRLGRLPSMGKVGVSPSRCFLQMKRARSSELGDHTAINLRSASR